MTTAIAARPHGLPRYNRGPDEHGVSGRGCRCGTCRAAKASYGRHRDRMIAYGRWAPHVDATGSRRRLQALIRNGWSMPELAARLGCSRQALRDRLDCARVTAAGAARISVLYDSLWDRTPPQGTRYEKTAATMARRYAAERGWVPPLAWDEIDDPAASPADGWERGDDGKREWGTLTAEALELAGFGLDERQIAERLGVSAGTLSVTLARARGKRAPAVQVPSGSAEVAAAIREARAAAGLTQRRLAAVVGVSEISVQLYERAERTPSAKTWIQLELTLGPLGVVREAAPERESAKADRAA
jgi:DNA-binding XRE family transcriptional regulator